MVALRLTRGAHPAVHLRRLLVAAASGGTGFLLLCSLGYALGHPGASPSALLLRLAWCVVPLAAAVWLAVAVARTDPATKPRPGLSAVGLGPARLMAISALTTALSTALGSMLALLVFLHLRGDLTGMPFDGAASSFLAADRPLPVPAALTLLAVLPATASAAVALSRRPREPYRPYHARRYGRFGAYSRTVVRETFGAYGRFGAHLRTAERPAPAGAGTAEGSRPVPQSARSLVTTSAPAGADPPRRPTRRPRSPGASPSSPPVSPPRRTRPAPRTPRRCSCPAACTPGPPPSSSAGSSPPSDSPWPAPASPTSRAVCCKPRAPAPCACSPGGC